MRITTERLKQLFLESMLILSQMDEPEESTWTYEDSDLQGDFMLFCAGVDAGIQFNRETK